MIDAAERLVNLALFLAQSRTPVTARTIREEMEGYPADQDEAGFNRMFERDKDQLRAAGFVLRTEDAGGAHAYRIDREATFMRPVRLDAEAAAALRAVGAALIEDPSFPFAVALRLALAKLAVSSPDAPPAPGASELADEDPGAQGRAAAELTAAAAACKAVAFRYEDAAGHDSSRRAEPYGLFLRDGRWYLVARDADRDAVRVFAVSRMSDLVVAKERPKTPDFERPAGLDVSRYVRLPFQYGEETFEARLGLSGQAAARAETLTEGRGSLATEGDVLSWTVQAADPDRLLRWAIENGPGIRVLGPPFLAQRMRDGLARVAERHGL